MISVKDKSLCCGCSSCALSCPTNAIEMVEDEAGFVFPSVNQALCINCSLCEKRCPVLNHENAEDKNHSVFIAYAKDQDVRFNGSSGGMFGLIAKNVISNGGVVFGAAFDEQFKLKCTPAQNEQQLYPLYKSKYLQSDIGDSFEKIKLLLDEGKQVLFVSTPCQVYALKLWLSKDYQNLITVDFVCHGVPSQSLFDKCRDFVEKRDSVKLLSYSFRAKKKNGATPHYYKYVVSKNGKAKEKLALYTDSPFYYGFQKYITLRDSCYDCHFSYSNRVSDITIGDFHEVDKYISGINRFDGVSNLVVNTPKGESVWEGIKNDTIFYELDFPLLLQNGELMCGGTKKPKQRDEFVNALASQPFEKVVEKYLDGRRQYTKKVYYALPKFLRKIMKKVLIK